MSESNEDNPVLKGRAFLHDVSNQLLVAHGMGNIVLNDINKNHQDKGIKVEKLEKSIKAMDKIMKMIEEYRSYLKSLS